MKIAIPSKILLLCLLVFGTASALRAQTKYGPYKNTTGAKGTATVNNTAVSDISNVTVNFPAIGLAKAATISGLKSNGTYDVTYTFRVKNYGSAALTGIQVRDTLTNTFPSPLTYSITSITATNGLAATTVANFDGTAAKPGLLNAASSTLAAGATATITVVVNVNAGLNFGTRNNTATAFGNTDNGTVIDVSTNGTDPDADGDGFAFDDATPTPVTINRPDIAITKTVNNATPDVGTNVTFTITAKNEGGDVNAFWVQEVLPSGYEYVTNNPSSGTSYSMGEWYIPNLAAGASKTLTISAKVLASGNYENTAYLKNASTIGDNNATNDTGRISVVPVPVADVSVSKTTTNATPDVGDNATFTITAKNYGLSTAENVSVTESIPAGLTFVSATVSKGTYTGTTWSIGSLAKDEEVTMTFVAKVLGNSTYMNRVDITTSTKESSTTNNAASSTLTPVPVADLAVTKTIDNLTPEVNSDVNFVVTVTNNGLSNATGVIVKDTLMSGYDVVGTIPSKGTYTRSTGTWNIGNLSVGESVTLTIPATVKPSGIYTNTAYVSGNEKDNDVTNNKASAAPTAVIPVADVKISKTVDSTTIDAGNELVFTLTATNDGLSTAHNVVVTDTLPAGYTFVSSTPTNAYNATTGIWAIDSLESGASAELKIRATVKPAGEYLNKAMISATEKDPVLHNNRDSVSVTVVPVVDVAVQKSVNNTTPDVGATVRFTIAATNNGPSTATVVSVEDALPSGYTFVSATASKGAYTAGVWSIGTLTNGETATLTVDATVNPTGDYKNAAQIFVTEKQTNLVNDTASVTPVPVPVTDLAITKTIINATPDAGATITFTLTATNNGPSDATGVKVVDTLLSGYTFLGNTATTGASSYNATTGIWTINSLPSGTSETLTIVATVNPTGDYNNSAIISGNEKESDTTNNKAVITTPVVRPIADLEIVKTVDSTTADAGSEVNFTLTAINHGVSTATNVVVNDVLPTGFTFVSSTSNNYDVSTGVWTIGTLAKDATASITVKALVNASGTYVNTATITATEHDPVTTNNTSSVTVTRVPLVDVAVVKTVNNSTPDVGKNVTFTIKATNAGPSTATNTVVNDALPTGYSLVSATPTAGTYTAGVWTIGTLAKDAEETLTIVATVNATGSYTNTATISATEKEIVTSNNTSSVTPVPVPVAELSIVKTIDNATPDAGSEVVFTVNVTNAGPSTATGVKVTEQLKSGYTYKSSTVTAGTYDAATGIWNIGTQNINITNTLTITAVVNPTGDYSNSAVVEGNEKDTDGSDDESTITTPTVRPIADVAVVKTVDHATADAGSEVNFTLTASNNGVSTATNVVVNDALPSGFTFVSSNSSNYDASTGVWTIGTLANDATASITIKAIVNASGTYVNTATISATEHDPVTTNNTSSVTVTRVPLVDVAVVKTVNNSTPDVGKNVTFTIKATNAGPSDATNTAVNDALPTGYTLVSATPTVGTYTAGVWTIGTLAKDAEETLTVVATVNATGIYTNTATISATEKEIVTNNNTSSVTPVPVPVAELSIVKTIDNATPDAGSEVMFTVNVTNAGPSTATGVTVTEQLKSGYTYKSSTVTAGTYDAATGIWNIGTQNINVTNTLTITAIVNPTGDYNNSASVSGNEKDTQGSNDSSVITTPTVRPIADVAVVKTVDHATADAGSEVNFTLTASNNGISTATNVVVNDVLPTGFTFVSSTSSNYDASTGVWTIGTLAKDATASITIKALVNASGTYVNTATITATEHDPVTTNNTSSVTVTRVPLVDVAVVKAVNNSTPDVGKNVTFTIKATNAGPSEATNTVVNDALPTGYTLVSATPTAGTYGAGVWNIGTLSKDAEETLTIVATVNATGSYTNTATISATEKEYETNNNTSSVTPVPVPVAELSIVKTIDNATPDAGAEVVFTVNVTNDGPSTATGVTVTEQLKSGYTYKSSTVTAGTYDAATGIWNIGTQSINVTNTLTITAIVNPTGDYNNSASVSGNEKDTQGSNDSSVITTPTVRPIADVAVVKTVDHATADAGSEVNFTLTASNNGVSTATNVVVNDALPSGFTFVSSTSSNYDASTGVWTIGTLAKDATASITIKAIVNASGTYVNTATIGATEHDPVTTNNTSSVTVTRVPLVDVAVLKTVNNSTPDVGKNVTFTIKATNAGPSDATNTAVNDALPTGYTLVSATPTVGTYTAGVWNIGTLSKDAEETLTVVATVNATGIYTNTATISATEKEIVTNNNTSSVTPVPVPVAELSIVKTIDNATPDAGAEVVFTVNVTNDGPSTATGVTVTEQLKSGYTYKSSTVTAGTYDAATGIWNIGTQSINVTNTLTITAIVNPTGDYNNSASVTGNEKDTQGTDDISTITTPTVRAITDLAIVKTVDHTTADAGSEVNFTLTASNNGVSTATNVVVNDALPSGFTFVSSTSSNYDASTGVWTIGTLAKDATASITIKAIVNASGTYVNTATIGATEHDPVTTNNTSSVTVTRVPLVDVAVLKTVNNSTPDVGKNVTFTIKATNAGPSDATNTVVNDALPTGYTLVSATPTAGTYTAGVWTIGTLVKDAEETLMIVATVNATGSYTNTATISATEKEIVTSNNTSSVTPVPVPVAELSIVKTLDNATPDAGSEVVFTVNVTNAGPSTATGVKVTEQLKSGYTYKSSTVTAGTYDAATGIWNIGTQHINITNTLTITAVVNPTGDYSNSASVSGNEKDTQGTDDVSTITTPIVRAITDLAIVKTVDHTTADAGSEVNFTLTASNKGVSTATNVVVNDVLPSGFTFVSSTSSNYNATTGVWSIGTLAKDATASITIKAIVNATGTYVNTATIAGTEHDPVTTNNTSAVTVTRVPYLDVAVTIGVNNSTPDVATNVTFTITATNNGPSTATNTVVNNLLPSGYTLVSANAATGSYTNGVWNIGTMAPGASTTLTVVATVRPTGTYTNTATIGAAEKETILTNNTASVTPTPVTVADISIAKSINNSTPDVGSQVVFTLTATNNGPSTATNVVATDMLQTGYTFVSATASAGTYNAATGTWTIGTLHAGTNATLTITARVNAGGNYGNTASITSNEKETNTGNNTSTITTPVPVPVTDLSIAKVVDDVAPYVGKDVNFTITVKNDGPSHATGVTMNDVLPTGYAYVSATASTGTYNATTGTWQIGALANGATATVTIKATILATGQFTNTATVTGNEKDLDASNNSASASTIPVANADLQITKSTTAVNPHVGDDITFTLVAKNNGPSDATNVIATDLLKAGYVFKSANPSTGTYNATTGTWTIGNMTNGATATLTITANIKGGGAYDNTATIRGNETDLVPANNTSTINPAVITLVAENDFGKTEEPTPVTVNVVKNDTYGNTGNKVVLTSNPQNGTVRNNNDGTVTYTPNEGFEGTDIFTYQLEDNLGNKSNMATVSIDVTKRLIDLAIAKVLITAPSDVMVGKNVTFDITVTNKSAKTATNVVVEDILESNIGDNFTQLQTFNGKAKLDMNTRKITWTVGQLTGGQVVKLTITAKVTGGGAVKNTATVSGADNDPDITNNTSTAAVPEMPNKPGVFIPTLITPNGDGQNDKFVILGLEKFPGSKLIIWNRWGNVVFRSNDYLNNWDGSQLNEGTYFYELVTPTQNGPKTYKGWLQLMR